MKKILSILAAVGLTVSTSSAVIACSNDNSEISKSIKEIYNFKNPETKEGWQELANKFQDSFFAKALELGKNLGFEVEEAEEMSAEQVQQVMNTPDFQICFANQLAANYSIVKYFILEEDKETAQDIADELILWDVDVYSYIISTGGDTLEVSYKIIKQNREQVVKYWKELKSEIEKIKTS
ncbi:lipoprotein [Spiroplasma alleghenense]|uniref:Lipoprotein n=1 Tax=Spiroplasma alleghenense TaxID=216931 RepID=A0A345Z510_9MOLU|nr:lipoprotein [Spiroplasma alleghenense]AXK51689.1 hypothetical protein SALLE_v1c10190 [Spiroplasma alleghenense]